MFNNNGFLHHFFTAVVLAGLGEIANALAAGPTGGTEAYLVAHPIVAVGVATVLPVAASYVHALIGKLSAEPAK